MMKHCLSLILTALLLAGCAHVPPLEGDAGTVPSSSPPSDQSVFEPVSLPEPAPEPEPEPDPRKEAIDQLLSSMTPEEKVGQLFFPRYPEASAAELAAQYHLGGYLLFTRDFKDLAGNWLTEEELVQTIQSYQDTAAIPMLIGVDEEGGTVVRASRDPELFQERCKSPQWLFAHQQGEEDVFAEDARAKNSSLLRFGINVNLAPVCDVSTDPKDFIYDRTLGQDAAATAEYVTSVVTAMKECGIGSVLKHFPGYGPNGDTHIRSAVDERPIESFRTGDLLPFQAGIKAGGGKTAVLVSHNIVTCIDPDRPGSLAPAMYRLLREELAFDGPALTDDLSMEAIARYAQERGQSPAVLALEAGCDMVITTDFQTQVPQVLEALKDGALSQERVDEALARVLGWKYDLGMIG